MFSTILAFLGGLGIFLYGTHLLSNALQRLAATKMREFLTTITNTRIKGVLSGIVVTFFLQSSTVTSILIVGLVGGSVITLGQAFGVVLGSAIGTTLTVQVLTFDVAKYASIFIFLGVILILFIKNELMKNIGSIALSIGFIFFGIGNITGALEPLSESSEMLSFLSDISTNPLLFALIGMLFTALMHSSAAMIIIGIAFVKSDVLSIDAVLPLVLGANVGSTLPVIISSLASSWEGRKLAFFNFLFKGTGVILALACLPLLTDLVPFLPGSAARQVANFHTLFNIAIAVLFFPLIPFIYRLFTKLFPRKVSDVAYEVRLNNSLLEVPDEALHGSKKEIVRLATHVQTNMITELRRFVKGDLDAEAIFQVEETIDASYIKIQKYLLKLGQQDLSASQSTEEVKLLNILNDIENIGDTVVSFIKKARKVSMKNIILTEKDHIQIETMLDHIEETYQSSLKAFEEGDHRIARKTIQSQSVVDQFEKDVKFEHFNSLINKQEHNPDISAVYLDIVNELIQVHHLSMNISRTVLGLI
ncbi:MAG TPA: Na/Pi cotransporter family protein [Virgibacillus sp.]|nr:Na/Pi cotransporter family protein [Virgibacillus sp.]